MTLVLDDFLCEPRILPPSGGAITLRFQAHRTGQTPHSMQAKYFIDPNESYVFVPQESNDPRSVFFPVGTGRLTPQAAPTFSDPKVVSVVPVGGPDPNRTEPLRINLELQGYNQQNQPFGNPRQDARDITVNALAMALGLLKNDLDLTNDHIGQSLGVHTSTVGKVMGGGNSPKIRAALEAILKGG